jgi:hypothetical protein
MKSLANILLLLFAVSLPTYGQQKAVAKIQFKHEVYDFDTIDIDTDGYSYAFHFTNTGTSPLFINDVISSCGCTIADWPTKPIDPGKKGAIVITFHATQTGSFVKTVLVKSNAANKPKMTLQIKGHVKDKSPQKRH